MNILNTVEFYHPSTGGVQEVVKQLSEHLVAFGHNVTVATSAITGRNGHKINGVTIAEFDISGNLVRGIVGSESEIRRYQNLLKNKKFDIVMNYAAQQWTTDLTYPVLSQIKAKTVIVPCGFSGLHDPDYIDYFKSLPNYLKQYNASVYLSNNYRDIKFARKHKLKNIFIIPNGADEREFSEIDSSKISAFREKYRIKNKESLVLCVGNHSSRKGHFEAIEAFKKAKIGKATLMIIGRGRKGCFKNCRKAARLSPYYYLTMGKKILSLETERKETVTAMKAADIFLHLSNIECSPLALFEASAAGTPFIASTAGNSQEIALWTGAGKIVKTYKKVKNGIIRPNINEAAKILTFLLTNKGLITSLGKNGRKVFFRKFTWDKIAKKYEKLYCKLLEEK